MLNVDIRGHIVPSESKNPRYFRIFQPFPNTTFVGSLILGLATVGTLLLDPLQVLDVFTVQGN